MSGLLNLLHRARHANAGSVALEAALVIPLFALMLTALVDLGSLGYRMMQVQGAANAGAQYALKYTWDAVAIGSTVAGATDAPGVTATPGPVQFCACAIGPIIESVSCDDPCPSGSPPGVYGRISARLSYTTMFTYPGVPQPMALDGEATVRIR